ncbi:uncharacterized protein F5Z01DRAFT_706049 [Emericellopsis atlantica]|uniref:Tetratricopeptide repeat protein 1 n=1 Tax=Emericellopsis atlantica TaxID=2614577 RepID=A0A9P7ZNU1_9HYPO|nr:uncharacterized protein F5Z01DRAFT_706049 [Emericellopsis atlantica]KAG9254928.1 hypothetical protein F5Z01DRAFT_706049 [Emericellopsis atlantica]
MATTQNSIVTNGGINGKDDSEFTRFRDIPNSLLIPTHGEQDEDLAGVEIGLENLDDDPEDLCTLLENEQAAKTFWMTSALAYAKKGSVDQAIDILIRGSNAVQANSSGSSTGQRDRVSMLCCLCWLYLYKSREAPRLVPEGVSASEVKTKEQYLQMATSSLNDVARLNPSFSPMYLARGVLLLLKASLHAPSKTGSVAGSEKHGLLKTAAKAFEDALRVSHGKNMLALMGKARTLYSMQKYPEAMAAYQDVLTKMPDLTDPDPRIGIGCCLWQLGYKDDARTAWERSLELNPQSKVATILLGQFYLDASSHLPVDTDEFLSLYKKAMTELTHSAFKIDKNMPLTCATFSSFFLSRKNWDNVDKLAHKAIDYTDVNAIASDGWYILARKEHSLGNVDKAADYYRRADDARGGTDRGYLPAKFGGAQLSVLRNDLGEAKLRLEKIIQQTRTYEAMVLLGTIYAEEVFESQSSDTNEDKSAEMKKAISFLENVRASWKDPKKSHARDGSVLLNLARLYELDNPEKALQCLQQAEQLELDHLPASHYPEGVTDEAEIRAALRKHLSPQLLNNIGCFHFQAEKYDQASDMFQAALGSCIRISDADPDADTDALVSSISYNLGRSYEAQGLTDKAVEVYEGLLKRHDDYIDARIRLAYIKLRKNPNKEGPDAVAKLYQENNANLDVRALYGWYLGKVHSRKRPANIQEDNEYRHYKHTLQHYDKHDRYALTAMGNLNLQQAREMRRETDHDKAKRSQQYARAVEFFDKALSLDPKNAYAAQGIAIANVEDKKDTKNGLQVFHKVRDTIKDSNLFMNLGHVYAELRQWSKAVENYEMALLRDGKANDPTILACLGRTCLNRGRAERKLEAYEKALECAQLALKAQPEQVNCKFNVAFVQIQLVTFMQGLPENQKSTEQLEAAAKGLEEAITSLDEIAAGTQFPYPKHDIEQRASMARNTLRKQLERAIGKQKEWEEANKDKIEEARRLREAEKKKRDEARAAAEAQEKERLDNLRKERERIQARDRELAAARDRERQEEEERKQAEMTTDEETGQKVKRKRKPAAPRGEGKSKQPRSRKKKNVDDDDEDDEASPAKKKRRLTQRKDNPKFKSSEIIVDSDEEDDDGALEAAEKNLEEREDSPLSELDEDEAGEKMDVDDAANTTKREDAGDEDEDDAPQQQSKRARRARVVDSDEEADADDEPARKSPVAAESGDEAGSPAAAADTSMKEAEDEDEE